MISRVSIKNFKSIGEGPNGEPGVDIELKPLTFFVGKNGAGKSSILEAIAYASQDFSTNRLMPGVTPGLLWHRNETTTVGEPPLPPQVNLWFNNDAGLGNQQGWPTFFDVSGQILDQPEDADKIGAIQRLSVILRKQTYMLRGTRGSVREKETTYGPHEWIGPEGQFLLPVLGQLNAKNRRTKEEIEKWSERFGIEYPSSALSESESQMLEGDYQDRASRANVNLSQASSGGRQALIVIVQVVLANKGSVLIIEEPEISLHPEAQLEMCRFLASQASKGKQVLATTHSQFMLLALRRPVVEGLIPVNAIAIYHVERNQDQAKGEIGATIAKPLPLSSEGFLEEWVPSFSTVETELAREWATTIRKKEEADEKPSRKRGQKSA